MPAFSASARTTDSKASANLRIAYCSKPGHVCKTNEVKRGKKRRDATSEGGVKGCVNRKPRHCESAMCLPLSN